MKNRKLYAYLVLAFMLSGFVYAQGIENQTLLSIDGVDYKAGIFIKTYLKNLDIVQDDAQKDVDNYLDLYIDYRLKMLQAYEQQLDTATTYQKELRNHRSTLAQGYLTDREVNDALVKEAYQRTQKEVNASHILVKIGRGDLPADTLTAWNKIHAIQKELRDGADFAQLARDRSEGPSAKVNGDLGWFSAFSMVYAFETAAYRTPVGQYSNVFRTDFGYHILKVNDMRDNPGEVTVAHIMTIDPRDSKEKTAATRIQDIYKQLQETGRFKELAREFSDDAQTAMKGGELKAFGTTGINAPAFVKAAFELKNLGDVSKPIQSKYGWHIIKLLEKHPVKSFELSKKKLKERIKRSPRARKVTQAFVQNLQDKYQVKTTDKVIDALNQFVSDAILQNEWIATKDIANKDQFLFNIKEQSYTYGDFYTYLEKQQRKDFKNYKDKKSKLVAMYKSYVNTSLMSYYEAHLEKENADFAFTYNEYKEGLLLFDLMERNIWDKARKDSVGQQNFYNQHKDSYNWKRRMDVILTQNTTQKVAQEVQSMLQKGKSMTDIKKEFNVNNTTQVILSSGIVEEDFNRLPDNFKIKKGVSDIYHDDTTGFYKVILVKEIIEPQPKSLDEARGTVINDYQQQLEKEWLNNLRINREIKIHKRTLKKVKKHIARISE